MLPQAYSFYHNSYALKLLARESKDISRSVKILIIAYLFSCFLFSDILFLKELISFSSFLGKPDTNARQGMWLLLARLPPPAH